MFEKEADWVAQALERLSPSAGRVIVNLGSSDLHFRAHVQPWIEQTIFLPLRARGVKIVHVDMRDGEGIDLRADILSEDGFQRLSAYRPDIVLCCNLVEHVENPQTLAQACLRLLPVGGHVILTAPLSYPYHRDPIDTLYRPDPAEIGELFARGVLKGEMIESAVLEPGSYRDEVKKRPWLLLRPILRLPFPFLSWSRWKRSMKRLYWLLYPYQVSCAVIRRTTP